MQTADSFGGWKSSDMNYIKKEFDNILMILSFTIMFFMITNLSYWSLDSLGIREYPYTETFQINGILSEKTIDDLACFCEKQECNALLINNLCMVGESYNMFLCDLYINIHKMPSDYKIDRYTWNKDQNQVYLGRCFSGNKRNNYLTASINIQGMDYTVLGFLPQKDIDDKRIFLYWENMDSSHKENFLENALLQNVYSYCIRIESFQEINTDTFFDYFKHDAILIKVTNAESGFHSFQSKIVKIISIILIAFLINSSALITHLWFDRRKKEYLILRTFGYDKKKLLILIVFELGKIIIFSLGLAWILEVIYIHVFVGIYFDMIKGLWTMILSLLGAMVIQVIILAVPCFQILNTCPTQSNMDTISL